MLSRVRARNLLAECRGDEIWSLPYCEERGVPAEWLVELTDCFEAGLPHRGEALWTDAGRVHQYHGVRDLDLALRLAEWLGVDVEPLRARVFESRALVVALREAVDE